MVKRSIKNNAGTFKRGEKKPIKNERFQVEISAGGIVYKRTPKGVRVSLILDPFGKWTFAKGHVEEGETIKEAAVRETMEEMGLNKLKVVSRLGKVDFWFKDQYRPATKGLLVHKYVHFYLMETETEAKGIPQKKENIRRIIWIPVNQLKAKSSYDDAKEIINKVVEQLKQIERRHRRDLLLIKKLKNNYYKKNKTSKRKKISKNRNDRDKQII